MGANQPSRAQVSCVPSPPQSVPQGGPILAETRPPSVGAGYKPAPRCSFPRRERRCSLAQRLPVRHVAPGMAYPDPKTLSEDERKQIVQAGMANASFEPRTVCLVILTVLAVFYTLYFSAGIVLPFLLAIVLNLLLQPAKRLLHERLRIPAALTALLLLLLLMAAVGGIGFAISVPAGGWIAKAPQALPELQKRLNFLAEPVAFVRHGIDQLSHLMQQTPPDGQAAPQAAPQAAASAPNLGGVGLSVLQGTRTALGEILTLVVVLFFLLTAGDSLLRGFIEILPTFGDKKRAVTIANEIERNVSGYLVTITIMNLLVGLANGISMWAMGMPDPLLWGVVAFLLNYIPILGPVTGIAVFFGVGLFSSPSILWALAPSAVYLAIHVIEGETVTPMLLARRFTLNPVLVIVSLFFWDWLWGVPGALVAVPLLAIAKIVCDRVDVLMPLGHILGASSKEGGKATRVVA